MYLKFARPAVLILLLLNMALGQKFEGYSSAKRVVIGTGGELPAEPADVDTLIFPTSDIDIDIPATTIMRPNAIGVVIGISKYAHSDVPRVDYARRDALLMRDYMIRVMGFSEDNIIMALDGDATQAVFNRIFGGQLENFIKAGESDVFVYYSGHGAPDVNKSTAYFVAHDTDPNYPVQTGYSLESFYAQLDQLEAKSVTVVLDACFSGASEAGMVIQQASPIFIAVENPAANLKNGVVMTSSSGDQISSWYREKGHGLFTYFFLKGLRGEADRDQDDKVTSTELYGYLMENIPYLARRKFNREQTPQLMGEALDQVLVAY